MVCLISAISAMENTGKIVQQYKYPKRAYRRKDQRLHVLPWCKTVKCTSFDVVSVSSTPKNDSFTTEGKSIKKVCYHVKPSIRGSNMHYSAGHSCQVDMSSAQATTNVLLFTTDSIHSPTRNTSSAKT